MKNRKTLAEKIWERYELVTITDEEYKALKNGLEIALKNAMSLTDEERKNYGYKVKKFVEDNKNAKSQCAKIVDLLKLK